MAGPKWRQPSGRGYLRPKTDETIPGVTTFLKPLDAEPGGLIGWATNTTADAAITHRDAWAKLGSRDEAAQLIKSEARKAQAVKRDIGTAVHGAVEAVLGADIREERRPNVHPALAPYVAALDLFTTDTGWTPLLIELTVVNTQWGYAGTLDALGHVAGVPTIVDWKSGSVRPTTGPAQINAYAYGDVVLNDDGTEDPVPWPSDVALWIVQLTPNDYTINEVDKLEPNAFAELVVALQRIEKLSASLPAGMRTLPPPVRLEGNPVR